MKRSETMTIRVTPELKDAFKELFKGEMASNAFEKLVLTHIKKELRSIRDGFVGMTETLRLYSAEGNQSETVVSELKSSIDRYYTESERLEAIAEMIGGVL